MQLILSNGSPSQVQSFFVFQNNCAVHCTEKFLKVMQRVGVRIQEVQVMQNEGILGAPDPPK